MLRQAISKKRKWFLLHLVPPRDDPLQTAIWPNLGFMALCYHPTWRAKKPYLPQSDLYPIRTRPIKKPFWAPSVPKPFYMFFFEACSNPTWPKLDLLALWRPRLPQKFFLRRVSRNSSKEGFLVLNIPIWCTFCEGRIFRMLVLTYHLKGLPWARPLGRLTWAFTYFHCFFRASTPFWPCPVEPSQKPFWGLFVLWPLPNPLLSKPARKLCGS